VRPGTAVAIATGAPLPPGADAVVKVEHTQAATPELLEILRPATPGEGMVRADEDAAPGAELVPAGRPLRAHDLGMLAAAGLVEVPVHARPRVTVVSTGDELVPAAPDAAAAPAALPVGQVRDATAPALAALVREAGGQPHFAGIVPDDREALAATLRAALPESDVLVVSAGSSVGARDETAASIASLGEPGIWCHGLAFRPGKPTLLADCGGVPVIGLPGNPRSALVVFRLIGTPIVRMVGGCTDPPPEPTVRARLERDLPSAAGRLDVVQVRLEAGDAVPLFGSSSLLSILTAADGYVVVPEAATGLAAGSEVEVTLYG
jgi:molybdopterin molybdotransferase